jgi:hypothetical protein
VLTCRLGFNAKCTKFHNLDAREETETAEW